MHEDNRQPQRTLKTSSSSEHAYVANLQTTTDQSKHEVALADSKSDSTAVTGGQRPVQGRLVARVCSVRSRSPHRRQLHGLSARLCCLLSASSAVLLKAFLFHILYIIQLLRPPKSALESKEKYLSTFFLLSLVIILFLMISLV